jgi:hypothetical protein
MAISLPDVLMLVLHEPEKKRVTSKTTIDFIFLRGVFHVQEQQILHVLQEEQQDLIKNKKKNESISDKIKQHHVRSYEPVG